jgi:hypothetical protein
MIPSVLVVVAGCNQKSDPDSAKLDAFLSGKLVDRVDMVSFVSKTGGLIFRTNTLTGFEATKCLISLMKTNRIDTPDTTKDPVEEQVYLMHGTNALCHIDVYDNGLWKIGNYSFRVRSTP